MGDYEKLTQLVAEAQAAQQAQDFAAAEKLLDHAQVIAPTSMQVHALKLKTYALEDIYRIQSGGAEQDRVSDLRKIFEIWRADAPQAVVLAADSCIQQREELVATLQAAKLTGTSQGLAKIRIFRGIMLAGIISLVLGVYLETGVKILEIGLIIAGFVLLGGGALFTFLYGWLGAKKQLKQLAQPGERQRLFNEIIQVDRQLASMMDRFI